MFNQSRSSRLIFILCTVLATCFLANAAMANVQTSAQAAASKAGLPGLPTEGLGGAIGKVIGGAMGIIGTLLFVYMLYGGFRWMIAGGDAASVKKAQSILMNSIIGIVIVMSAYALSNFVVSKLVTVATNGQGASQASPGTGTGSAGAGTEQVYCGFTNGVQNGYGCTSPSQQQAALGMVVTCTGQMDCQVGWSCCKATPFCANTPAPDAMHEAYSCMPPSQTKIGVIGLGPMDCQPGTGCYANPK